MENQVYIQGVGFVDVKKAFEILDQFSEDLEEAYDYLDDDDDPLMPRIRAMQARMSSIAWQIKDLCAKDGFVHSLSQEERQVILARVAEWVKSI